MGMQAGVIGAGTFRRMVLTDDGIVRIIKLLWVCLGNANQVTLANKWVDHVPGGD